jgi:hypothetical protein
MAIDAGKGPSQNLFQTDSVSWGPDPPGPLRFARSDEETHRDASVHVYVRNTFVHIYVFTIEEGRQY